MPRHSEAPDRPGLPALGAGNRLVGHRQPVGTWGHVWGHGWGRICGDMGTQEHKTWDVRDLSKWDMGTQTHMDKVTLTPESTGASPPKPKILQHLVQGCASRCPSLCVIPPLRVPPPSDPCPLCPLAVSSFSYLIGKDTWLEAWPSEVACQEADLQPICQDFVEFAEAMTMFGCPS